MSSSTDTPLLHRLIRGLASMAASSFFYEIRVIGWENVPKDGPIIVTATHHNMMLDPVILSVGFPHGRMMNYWSKASLFANPIMKYILLSSGNIPVDRKSKDRQVLFKGTFEALSRGQAVALFPEGTSYTEPRIMQVKDGAAWAALEYTKWAKENPGKAVDKEIVIIPAAIVYTNKSKYRSGVIMEFGKPITMDPYKEQFFSGAEGAPRAAVKRLTGTIERELVEATINAPDWETLYAARMARDLLWEKVQSINLDEFVIISQTLVDLFATPDATPNVASVRRRLLDYYSLLQTTHLTNSVLSSLPLPRNLDPNTPASIPSRLYTLLVLIRDSLSAAVYLPFFFFPLVVHTPAYIMGRLGARLVEHEEETQAQNKVAFGLISLMGTYSVAFFFLWALFGYTIIRAILAGFLVYLFANYHNRMIDDTYERLKRFIAAWRLLVGVWAPRRWDLPFESLSWYTTPQLPPENPWIKRPKTPRRNTPSTPASNSSPHISPSPSTSTLGSISGDLLATQPPEPPVKGRRRPPSRKLMRHVLRARVEAIKALAGFFDQLERAGGNKRIQASVHLARRFKGTVETVRVPAAEYELPTGAESSTGNSNSAHDQSQGTGHEEIQFVDEEQGWRDAREVIDFLRRRGAKIPSLGAGESEWAALTSEAELGTPGSESEGPF